MGVEPRKQRQQRGVNIDDPALIGADEIAREQPHEPGKADEVGREIGKQAEHRGLVRLFAVVILAGKSVGGDAAGLRL